MTQVDNVLTRLRRGQRWLTDQHQLFLAGDPVAATDEKFSKAIAAWDQLERVYRCAQPAGCILGPGSACAQDGPVICDGCVGQ